jgi:hypothetical protein
MKIFRLTSLALAATLPILIGGGSAYADSGGVNHRIFVGGAGSGAYPAGACAFLVDFTFVSKEYVVKATDNPDGSQSSRVTGSASVTLTNDTTGKSIAVNISGPATLTDEPDGSGLIDAQGHQIYWWNKQEQANLGLPGGPDQLFLYTGHVVIRTDPNGVGTSWTRTGSVTDLCAALSK